jgi:3-methyladenine DNA glycosylase/8-oxoguanine DNA glycosylase
MSAGARTSLRDGSTVSATHLSLATPTDYVLHRDACSYGYFLLSPNAWDPGTGSLWRVLTLGAHRAKPRAVLVHISQAVRRASGRSSAKVTAKQAAPLVVVCRPAISASEAEEVRAQLVRMLRLDESAETIAAFHRKDPRFASGGHGRLMRSPTLFEDIIKTVTSCNMQWPGTMSMNRKLCEVLGTVARLGRGERLPEGVEAHGFPTPRQVATARASTLRARCRTGYRDQRMIAIAKRFVLPVAKGGLDASKLEDPATTDDVVMEMLLELPGIGPYAAANIMQLLGRYHRLPLDSESVRHGRMVLGMRGSSAQVMRRVKAHFAPFGEHAFRSYWFELREFYESVHGPAHLWAKETTGKLFTAALLKKKAKKRATKGR